MKPAATITFQQIALHRLRLAAQTAISPYVLRNADCDVVMDQVSQRLIARLDSHVLGEKDSETLRVVEEPVWLSWRHQLVGSLPHGFRRRFLSYFWDLDGQPLAKRVTHEVTAEAWRVFPACTADFPKHMGAPVLIASCTAPSYTEDLT